MKKSERIIQFFRCTYLGDIALTNKGRVLLLEDTWELDKKTDVFYTNKEIKLKEIEVTEGI